MVGLGKNMSSLKENNKKSIILYIHKYGPSSRKTIADVIGITQAAVGKICKELIDMKLLYELGSKDSIHAGRREVLLGINYKKFYCIGVNLFRENIVALATYMNGEEIKKVSKNYDNEEDIITQTINLINTLIEDLNLDKDDILGIGISSRGKTDYSKGNIILLSGEVVPIKQRIESELGIKTYVNNNVRNLMIQEMSTLNSTRDTIFIKWGPGLGSAIYINEKIVYGSNLKAGEIGKIIVNESNGKQSTLEDIFNKGQIVNDVMNNFNKSTMPILSKLVDSKEDINIDNIIEVLNSTENDYVKQIILDKIDLLLEKLYSIDSVLDFKNIVFYGKIFEQDYFFNQIQKIINNKFPTMIGKAIKSQLKQENEYCSPIYLVMSNIFE